MKYKKYNNFSEIQEHQDVKLVTLDCWNQLFGVVEFVSHEYKMAIIFCSAKPDCRYFVFNDNMSDIIMVK